MLAPTKIADGWVPTGVGAFWNNLIGRRLLKAMLLFALAVVLFLSASELYLEYRVGLSAIEQRLDEIEDSYASVASDRLWAVDSAGLGLLAKGIAGLPAIRYVEIRETGTLRQHVAPVAIGMSPRERPLSRVIPLMHVRDSLEIKIGELRVEATREELHAYLWRRGGMILGEQAAKSFLLATFFLLIVHRLVVARIADMSARLADFGGVTADGLQANGDEIDHMRIIFEAMADNIAVKDAGLRRSLAFSEGIIGAMPDLLFEVDRHGTYFNIWTRQPELLAAPPASLLGRRIPEILSEEAAADAMACIREADETGRSVGKVIRIDLPQGPAWFELSCTKIASQDGAEPHFLAVSRDITGRRMVEAKVKAKAQAYRALAEGSPDYIIRYDLNHRVLYLNTKLTKLLELERPEDLIGKRPLDVWPDGRYTRIDHAVERAIETGEMVSVDWSPAPGVFWHILVEPERDEAGTIVGTLAFGRDISNIMRAEREKARLSEALDHSADSFFLIRGDGRIENVNIGACRTLGFSRDEFTRMSVVDVDPDHSMEAVRNSLVSLRPGEPVSFESRHRAKDGRAFPVEITLSLFEDGGERSAIAVARDISERKRMERELAQRELEFRSLVENLPDDIVRLDRDLGVQFCNGAVLARMGRHQEDVLGKPLSEVIPEAHVSILTESARRVVDEGRSNVVEIVLKEANPPVTMEIQHVPEFDDAGNVISVLGIGRDISARKAKEEIERRLVEARKFEALGQLAGSIAHDFNNLLGAILGFVDLLIDEVPHDSTSGDLASRISSATEHGRELVAQILTFARRSEFHFTAVSLFDVLNDARGLLTGTLRTTSGLLVSSEGNVGDVLGDRGKLVHMLVNLCVNAHHALNGLPGRVTLSADEVVGGGEAYRRLCDRAATGAETVDVWRGSDGTAHAVAGRLVQNRRYRILRVADTGCGMDESLLGQVFTPFFTTKGSGHGTGLGLAAVHGTVLAHGGALAVESRLGEGTVFEVFLPAANEPRFQDEDDGSSGGAGIPMVPGGLRVLLVDDDPHFRDMLFTVLDCQGFDVEACSDPREALESVEEFGCSWDIMISDQTMPHMNGLELVRAVRELCPELPCILCTGFSKENLNDEVLRQAGVFALLRKPLDTRALVEVMAHAVAWRGDSPNG